MLRSLLILGVIGFSTAVHADTCTDLLTIPKDPRIAEAMQKFTDYLEMVGADQQPNDRDSLRKFHIEVKTLLATRRLQDIPLDYLDRIARTNFRIGKEWLFTKELQEQALALLKKQSLPENQAEQLIRKIETEISEIALKIMDRRMDVAKKPSTWRANEIGMVEYDLMVLKHILYTQPHLLKTPILIIMEYGLNSQANSGVRDNYYAAYRVHELLGDYRVSKDQPFDETEFEIDLNEEGKESF